jgi:hypothetical protein
MRGRSPISTPSPPYSRRRFRERRTNLQLQGQGPLRNGDEPPLQGYEAISCPWNRIRQLMELDEIRVLFLRRATMQSSYGDMNLCPNDMEANNHTAPGHAHEGSQEDRQEDASGRTSEDASSAISQQFTLSDNRPTCTLLPKTPSAAPKPVFRKWPVR